jgi:gliding motility-associated-like protein
MKGRLHIVSAILLTGMIILITGSHSFAQTAMVKDSISHNSTCVGYKIGFNSSVFDRIGFPDKVIWNFGDPASGFYNGAGIQMPTHAYASTGDYPVSLIVVSGGDSIKLYDTIRVIAPVSWNFGPDVFLCENGHTTLQAPPVSGATYQWNDDSLTTTDTLNVTKTGVYTVLINGCAVTDSIGIFYSDSPAIKLGDDHVLCAGETLTLNAASQNGVYAWKLNGSLIPADTLAQAVTTAPGGEYIALVTVPGCGSYSDTVNITYGTLPAPAFSLGPDTLLCPKEIYTLTASVASATAYSWNDRSTDSILQVSGPGTYWAFVTVSGQCQVVDSVDITYRGDKNLDFHDTAICKGSTLILDADFGTGTYNWVSDPPQRSDQNQTGQSTYYVYEPGLYSVTASVGQCVYKDSLHVTFNDSLDLFIGRDTSLCIGEEYILHVQTNANDFAWQDGSTASQYEVADSGIYTVIAENGCGKDTASVHVSRRHCDCQLTLPNAFSPNGDGLNDLFHPLHPCKMSNFSLRIFDRYGELVFQSNDPSLGWNGTYRGIKADNGSYVWMASYINTDTHLHSFSKGFVILAR